MRLYEPANQPTFQSKVKSALQIRLTNFAVRIALRISVKRISCSLAKACYNFFSRREGSMIIEKQV
jgi:hypothetical protein